MIDFLNKIKNLELHTDEGKINYRWGLVLVAIVATLTIKDWVIIGICYVVETVKTYFLHQDIVEEAETANVLMLVIIVAAFFILCIEILYYHDKKKKELNEKIENSKNE